SLAGEIIAGMEDQFVNAPGQRRAAEQGRVTAAILIGGCLREQGAGIAVEAVEFKGDALGWHTVHGVQDMGGEFSHGIYAGQYPANRPPVWPDPMSHSSVRETPGEPADFGAGWVRMIVDKLLSTI